MKRHGHERWRELAPHLLSDRRHFFADTMPRVAHELFPSPWDLASELVSEERGIECGFRFRADSGAKSHIRAARSSQLVVAPHGKEELVLGCVTSVRAANDCPRVLPEGRSRTTLRPPRRVWITLTQLFLFRARKPVRRGSTLGRIARWDY